jgi:ferredoxin-NADP reductase
MSTVPPLSARVRTLRYEAEGILGVELIPLPGTHFPRFEAGAHIDIKLDNGVTRSYSLLNDSEEVDRYVLGILSDPNSRGGSRFVHEQLRCGSILKFTAPRNNFPLDESAVHSVLIAGGIGVTPILSMARRLNKLGHSAELIYCVRRRDQAAFLDELQGLAGLALSVRVHIDDEQGGPLDLTTVLTAATAKHGNATHAYCCGPGPMLLAFEQAARAAAIDKIHLERFAADTTIAHAPTTGYTVVLARSKREVLVGADKNLLDALLEAGVQADYSCMEGVCGTCETRVLEGCPEHRDSVLSDAEKAAGKVMMICVSGATGDRLVLDL